MKNLLTNSKLAVKFAKGVCGLRITGGATYKVNGLADFTREIWICPVTLTVLGHYPKHIYIKKLLN